MKENTSKAKMLRRENIHMKNKNRKKKFSIINILQVVTIIVLLAYMQIAVDQGKISKVFIASPTMIIKDAIKIINDGTLFEHLIVTLEEVFAGFFLAAAVGIVVALIWTLFPKIEEYMDVFCSAIMAIPKTAILPLLILWFGIGFKSKVVLVFLFSVFQILYNTVTGVKQTDVKLLKVAKVFKANRIQTVFQIMIPSSLPSMFNGLKLAAATALTGVIFSEMQSAKAGLGYLLSEAQNLLNSARMFFVIILVTVISVLFVQIINGIEYAICHKWQNKLH